MSFVWVNPPTKAPAPTLVVLVRMSLSCETTAAPVATKAPSDAAPELLPEEIASESSTSSVTSPVVVTVGLNTSSSLARLLSSPAACA